MGWFCIDECRPQAIHIPCTQDSRLCEPRAVEALSAVLLGLATRARGSTMHAHGSTHGSSGQVSPCSSGQLSPCSSGQLSPCSSLEETMEEAWRRHAPGGAGAATACVVDTPPSGDTESDACASGRAHRRGGASPSAAGCLPPPPSLSSSAERLFAEEEDDEGEGRHHQQEEQQQEQQEQSAVGLVSGKAASSGGPGAQPPARSTWMPFPVSPLPTPEGHAGHAAGAQQGH